MTSLIKTLTPDSRENLCPAQKRVFNGIQLLIVSAGQSPTFQEIADHLGVSKVTVYEHFREIERKGYATRDPNRARSIKIVAIDPVFRELCEEALAAAAMIRKRNPVLADSIHDRVEILTRGAA